MEDVNTDTMTALEPPILLPETRLSITQPLVLPEPHDCMPQLERSPLSVSRESQRRKSPRVALVQNTKKIQNNLTPPVKRNSSPAVTSSLKRKCSPAGSHLVSGTEDRQETLTQGSSITVEEDIKDVPLLLSHRPQSLELNRKLVVVLQRLNFDPSISQKYTSPAVLTSMSRDNSPQILDCEISRSKRKKLKTYRLAETIRSKKKGIAVKLVKTPTVVTMVDVPSKKRRRVSVKEESTAGISNPSTPTISTKDESNKVDVDAAVSSPLNLLTSQEQFALQVGSLIPSSPIIETSLTMTTPVSKRSSLKKMTPVDKISIAKSSAKKTHFPYVSEVREVSPVSSRTSRVRQKSLVAERDSIEPTQRDYVFPLVTTTTRPIRKSIVTESDELEKEATIPVNLAFSNLAHCDSHAVTYTVKDVLSSDDANHSALVLPQRRGRSPKNLSSLLDDTQSSVLSVVRATRTRAKSSNLKSRTAEIDQTGERPTRVTPKASVLISSDMFNIPEHNTAEDGKKDASAIHDVVQESCEILQFETVAVQSPKAQFVEIVNNQAVLTEKDTAIDQTGERQIEPSTTTFNAALEVVSDVFDLDAISILTTEPSLSTAVVVTDVVAVIQPFTSDVIHDTPTLDRQMSVVTVVTESITNMTCSSDVIPTSSSMIAESPTATATSYLSTVTTDSAIMNSSTCTVNASPTLVESVSHLSSVCATVIAQSASVSTMSEITSPVKKYSTRVANRRIATVKSPEAAFKTRIGDSLKKETLHVEPETTCSAVVQIVTTISTSSATCSPLPTTTSSTIRTANNLSIETSLISARVTESSNTLLRVSTGRASAFRSTNIFETFGSVMNRPSSKYVASAANSSTNLLTSDGATNTTFTVPFISGIPKQSAMAGDIVTTKSSIAIAESRGRANSNRPTSQLLGSASRIPELSSTTERVRTTSGVLTMLFPTVGEVTDSNLSLRSKSADMPSNISGNVTSGAVTEPSTALLGPIVSVTIRPCTTAVITDRGSCKSVDATVVPRSNETVKQPTMTVDVEGIDRTILSLEMALATIDMGCRLLNHQELSPRPFTTSSNSKTPTASVTEASDITVTRPSALNAVTTTRSSSVIDSLRTAVVNAINNSSTSSALAITSTVSESSTALTGPILSTIVKPNKTVVDRASIVQELSTDISVSTISTTVKIVEDQITKLSTCQIVSVNCATAPSTALVTATSGTKTSATTTSVSTISSKKIRSPSPLEITSRELVKLSPATAKTTTICSSTPSISTSLSSNSATTTSQTRSTSCLTKTINVLSDSATLASSDRCKSINVANIVSSTTAVVDMTASVAVVSSDMQIVSTGKDIEISCSTLMESTSSEVIIISDTVEELTHSVTLKPLITNMESSGSIIVKPTWTKQSLTVTTSSPILNPCTATSLLPTGSASGKKSSTVVLSASPVTSTDNITALPLTSITSSTLSSALKYTESVSTKPVSTTATGSVNSTTATDRVKSITTSSLISTTVGTVHSVTSAKSVLTCSLFSSIVGTACDVSTTKSLTTVSNSSSTAAKGIMSNAPSTSCVKAATCVTIKSATVGTTNDQITIPGFLEIKEEIFDPGYDAAIWKSNTGMSNADSVKSKSFVQSSGPQSFKQSTVPRTVVTGATLFKTNSLISASTMSQGSVSTKIATTTVVADTSVNTAVRASTISSSIITSCDTRTSSTTASTTAGCVTSKFVPTIRTVINRVTPPSSTATKTSQYAVGITAKSLISSTVTTTKSCAVVSPAVSAPKLSTLPVATVGAKIIAQSSANNSTTSAAAKSVSISAISLALTIKSTTSPHIQVASKTATVATSNKSVTALGMVGKSLTSGTEIKEEIIDGGYDLSLTPSRRRSKITPAKVATVMRLVEPVEESPVLEKSVAGINIRESEQCIRLELHDKIEKEHQTLRANEIDKGSDVHISDSIRRSGEAQQTSIAPKVTTGTATAVISANLSSATVNVVNKLSTAASEGTNTSNFSKSSTALPATILSETIKPSKTVIETVASLTEPSTSLAAATTGAAIKPSTTLVKSIAGITTMKLVTTLESTISASKITPPSIIGMPKTNDVILQEPIGTVQVTELSLKVNVNERKRSHRKQDEEETQLFDSAFKENEELASATIQSVNKIEAKNSVIEQQLVEMENVSEINVPVKTPDVFPCQVHSALDERDILQLGDVQKEKVQQTDRDQTECKAQQQLGNTQTTMSETQQSTMITQHLELQQTEHLDSITNDTEGQDCFKTLQVVDSELHFGAQIQEDAEMLIRILNTREMQESVVNQVQNETSELCKMQENIETNLTSITEINCCALEPYCAPNETEKQLPSRIEKDPELHRPDERQMTRDSDHQDESCKKNGAQRTANTTETQPPMSVQKQGSQIQMISVLQMETETPLFDISPNVQQISDKVQDKSDQMQDKSNTEESCLTVETPHSTLEIEIDDGDKISKGSAKDQLTKIRNQGVVYELAPTQNDNEITPPLENKTQTVNEAETPENGRQDEVTQEAGSMHECWEIQPHKEDIQQVSNDSTGTQQQCEKLKEIEELQENLLTQDQENKSHQGDTSKMIIDTEQSGMGQNERELHELEGTETSNKLQPIASAMENIESDMQSPQLQSTLQQYDVQHQGQAGSEIQILKIDTVKKMSLSKIHLLAQQSLAILKSRTQTLEQNRNATEESAKMLRPGKEAQEEFTCVWENIKGDQPGKTFNAKETQESIRIITQRDVELPSEARHQGDSLQFSICTPLHNKAPYDICHENETERIKKVQRVENTQRAPDIKEIERELELNSDMEKEKCSMNEMSGNLQEECETLDILQNDSDLNVPVVSHKGNVIVQPEETQKDRDTLQLGGSENESDAHLPGAVVRVSNSVKPNEIQSERKDAVETEQPADREDNNCIILHTEMPVQTQQPNTTQPVNKKTLSRVARKKSPTKGKRQHPTAIIEHGEQQSVVSQEMDDMERPFAVINTIEIQIPTTEKASVVHQPYNMRQRRGSQLMAKTKKDSKLILPDKMPKPVNPRYDNESHVVNTEVQETQKIQVDAEELECTLENDTLPLAKLKKVWKKQLSGEINLITVHQAAENRETEERVVMDVPEGGEIEQPSNIQKEWEVEISENNRMASRSEPTSEVLGETINRVDTVQKESIVVLSCNIEKDADTLSPVVEERHQPCVEESTLVLDEMSKNSNSQPTSMMQFEQGSSRCTQQLNSLQKEIESLDHHNVPEGGEIEQLETIPTRRLFHEPVNIHLLDDAKELSEINQPADLQNISNIHISSKKMQSIPRPGPLSSKMTRSSDVSPITIIQNDSEKQPIIVIDTINEASQATAETQMKCQTQGAQKVSGAQGSKSLRRGSDTSQPAEILKLSEMQKRSIKMQTGNDAHELRKTHRRSYSLKSGQMLEMQAGSTAQNTSKTRSRSETLSRAKIQKESDVKEPSKLLNNLELQQTSVIQRDNDKKWHPKTQPTHKIQKGKEIEKPAMLELGVMPKPLVKREESVLQTPDSKSRRSATSHLSPVQIEKGTEHSSTTLRKKKSNKIGTTQKVVEVMLTDDVLIGKEKGKVMQKSIQLQQHSHIQKGSQILQLLEKQMESQKRENQLPSKSPKKMEVPRKTEEKKDTRHLSQKQKGNEKPVETCKESEKPVSDQIQVDHDFPKPMKRNKPELHKTIKVTEIPETDKINKTSETLLPARIEKKDVIQLSSKTTKASVPKLGDQTPKGNKTQQSANIDAKNQSQLVLQKQTRSEVRQPVKTELGSDKPVKTELGSDKQEPAKIPKFGEDHPSVKMLQKGSKMQQPSKSRNITEEQQPAMRQKGNETDQPSKSPKENEALQSKTRQKGVKVSQTNATQKGEIDRTAVTASQLSMLQKKCESQQSVVQLKIVIIPKERKPRKPSETPKNIEIQEPLLNLMQLKGEQSSSRSTDPQTTPKRIVLLKTPVKTNKDGFTPLQNPNRNVDGSRCIVPESSVKHFSKNLAAKKKAGIFAVQTSKNQSGEMSTEISRDEILEKSSRSSTLHDQVTVNLSDEASSFAVQQVGIPSNMDADSLSAKELKSIFGIDYDSEDLNIKKNLSSSQGENTFVELLPKQKLTAETFPANLHTEKVGGMRSRGRMPVLSKSESQITLSVSNRSTMADDKTKDFLGPLTRKEYKQKPSETLSKSQILTDLLKFRLSEKPRSIQATEKRGVIGSVADKFPLVTCLTRIPQTNKFPALIVERRPVPEKPKSKELAEVEVILEPPRIEKRTETRDYQSKIETGEVSDFELSDDEACDVEIGTIESPPTWDEDIESVLPSLEITSIPLLTEKPIRFSPVTTQESIAGDVCNSEIPVTESLTFHKASIVCTLISQDTRTIVNSGTNKTISKYSNTGSLVGQTADIISIAVPVAEPIGSVNETASQNQKKYYEEATAGNVVVDDDDSFELDVTKDHTVSDKSVTALSGHGNKHLHLLGRSSAASISEVTQTTSSSAGVNSSTRLSESSIKLATTSTGTIPGGVAGLRKRNSTPLLLLTRTITQIISTSPSSTASQPADQQCADLVTTDGFAKITTSVVSGQSVTASHTAVVVSHNTMKQPYADTQATQSVAERAESQGIAESSGTHISKTGVPESLASLFSAFSFSRPRTIISLGGAVPTPSVISSPAHVSDTRRVIMPFVSAVVTTQSASFSTMGANPFKTQNIEPESSSIISSFSGATRGKGIDSTGGLSIQRFVNSSKRVVVITKVKNKSMREPNKLPATGLIDNSFALAESSHNFNVSYSSRLLSTLSSIPSSTSVVSSQSVVVVPMPVESTKFTAKLQSSGCTTRNVIFAPRNEVPFQVVVAVSTSVMPSTIVSSASPIATSIDDLSTISHVPTRKYARSSASDVDFRNVPVSHKVDISAQGLFSSSESVLSTQSITHPSLKPSRSTRKESKLVEIFKTTTGQPTSEKTFELLLKPSEAVLVEEAIITKTYQSLRNASKSSGSSKTITSPPPASEKISKIWLKQPSTDLVKEPIKSAAGDHSEIQSSATVAATESQKINMDISAKAHSPNMPTDERMLMQSIRIPHTSELPVEEARPPSAVFVTNQSLSESQCSLPTTEVTSAMLTKEPVSVNTASVQADSDVLILNIDSLMTKSAIESDMPDGVVSEPTTRLSYRSPTDSLDFVKFVDDFDIFVQQTNFNDTHLGEIDSGTTNMLRECEKISGSYGKSKYLPKTEKRRLVDEEVLLKTVNLQLVNSIQDKAPIIHSEDIRSRKRSMPLDSPVKHAVDRLYDKKDDDQSWEEFQDNHLSHKRSRRSHHISSPFTKKQSHHLDQMSHDMKKLPKSFYEYGGKIYGSSQAMRFKQIRLDRFITDIDRAYVRNPRRNAPDRFRSLSAMSRQFERTDRIGRLDDIRTNEKRRFCADADGVIACVLRGCLKKVRQGHHLETVSLDTELDSLRFDCPLVDLVTFQVNDEMLHKLYLSFFSKWL